MEQKNVLSQQLNQQQVQVQTLAPQQVLLARLTELPVDALRQRVENPWLEHSREDEDDAGNALQQGGSDSSGLADGEDMSTDERMGDYGNEDEIPDHLLNYPSGNNRPENMDYRSTLSFYDHLKDQIHEYDLTPHQQQVMEYLIGSLAEDGMLPKSLEQLADEAVNWRNCSTSCGSSTLQALEPALCRNVSCCRF